MAHCFTCSKDLSATSRIAKALTDAGYAVLRFDFTGLGDSEGEFESSTFVANVGDLTNAALWLIDQGIGPCGMLGHSLGGAATLIAAGRIRAVRSVATIGAPSSASHVRHLISDETQQQATIDGCAYGDIGGRLFPISISSSPTSIITTKKPPSPTSVVLYLSCTPLTTTRCQCRRANAFLRWRTSRKLSLPCSGPTTC